MSIRFTQSCPTCGRRVQVRASLIGYTVACQHCNAEFLANADGEDTFGGAASGSAVAGAPYVDPLMARVEQALQRAAEQNTVIS